MSVTSFSDKREICENCRFSDRTYEDDILMCKHDLWFLVRPTHNCNFFERRTDRETGTGHEKGTMT